MRRFSVSTPVVVFPAAVLAAIFWLSGCGGGVDTEPSVTARPRRAVVVSKPSNGGRTSINKTSAGTGSFKGTITFAGAAPIIGAPPGFNPNDPKHKACLAGGHQVKDFSLVVNQENKGLKNVFVYLAEAPLDYTAPGSEKFGLKELDQQGCTFYPHALIIRTGQVLEIKNSDEVLHNTNISPPKNSTFNKTLAKTTGDVKPETYEYENAFRTPVKVTCQFHKFMSAYQLALNHPFFSLTDGNGFFEIKNLPEGDYTFIVWHEKLGIKKINVTIDPGKTVEKNDIKF